MSILRYTASLDNTITNAFEEDLSTRGTGSNMGASDILEVFSIYQQATSASVELSRVLIQFPLAQITADRASGVLPTSGVTWKLKLYNAKHSETVPKSYRLQVSAVSASWEEGTGLDMEAYSDLTEDDEGSNWIKKAGSTSWATIGGDYHSTPAPIANTETDFDTGLENLEVNVTTIVDRWIAGTTTNYGFGVRLTDAYEGYFSSSTGANTATEIHNTSGAKKSYYTKKFFGRGTEFFFKRPVLEAQFNDTKKDHRGNFTLSSSALPAADNLNRLYCYNYVRGRLIDIAGDNSIQPVVKLYYSSGSVPEGSVRGFRRGSDNVAVTSLSATRESEGVFYIEIAATSSIVTTTYPYLVDVWETPGGEEFFTGSAVTPVKFSPSNEKSRKNYVMSMTNLKEEYQADQTVRLRVYAREKNWSPNIYTTAKSKPENYTIESGSYRLLRVVDDLEVISYGTGSVKYSELSYDVSGNYFDIDMSLLDPGYQYGFKFSIYDDYTQTYVEQPYLFKFRVIK